MPGPATAAVLAAPGSTYPLQQKKARSGSHERTTEQLTATPAQSTTVHSRSDQQPVMITDDPAPHCACSTSGCGKHTR